MKEYPLDYRPGSVPAPVAEIPFFKILDPVVIEGMLANTTIVDAEPGEVIIEEGAEAHSMLFLLKGRIRIQKDGSIIAAASESGDLLGEIALLQEGNRTATIVAETHAYCLKVKQDFLDSLDSEKRNAYYAAMYRFLAELLAQRLEKTTEKLAAAEKMAAEARHG